MTLADRAVRTRFGARDASLLSSFLADVEQAPPTRCHLGGAGRHSLQGSIEDRSAVCLCDGVFRLLVLIMYIKKVHRKWHYKVNYEMYLFRKKYLTQLACLRRPLVVVEFAELRY